MTWSSRDVQDAPEEPERRIAEKPEAADSGMEEQPDDHSGTTILEDNEERVWVAAHAGDSYSKANEAASVRMEIERSGSSVARITSFEEADFAKGTGAARSALRRAESLARNRDVGQLRLDSDETDCSGVPSSRRRDVIRTMLQEGFDVGYRTRMPNGEERFIREIGPAAREAPVLGEPVAFHAVKDLRTEGERGDRHLVPATVIEEIDDAIARSRAETDSRIQGRELRDRDERIIKGDAGEGRTYVDLVSRYGRERIISQPEFDDPDRPRNPDFVVMSERHVGEIEEIVDAKAWSMRRKDEHGRRMSHEEFFRMLQEDPRPDRLVNIHELRAVVTKYASSPHLARDGKVVIYLPEDVTRHAPQVKTKIEGWSGTEIAQGRTVEVRSMGAHEEDLWEDTERRRKSS